MKKLTINEKYAEFRNTYKVSKMLLGYVWHLDRKLFLGNLISIMIPGIVPFLNAIIYAEIINLIVRAVEGHAPDYRYLFSLIAARIISLFILDVSFALQRRYEVLVWTKLPMHLYQDVLASITNLDIERFEDSDFKDHLERVRDSFNWRPMNMLNNLFLLFQGIIQVTIAAISLIYLNWLFAVLLLVASLPMFFYQTSFAKLIWVVWDENSPYRKRFWYITELLQNADSVKELKLYQLSRHFLKELHNIHSKFVKENESSIKKHYWQGIGSSFLNVASYAIIEIYIILKTIHKHISVGGLSYYTTVVVNYQSGLNGMFRSASQIFDYSQYVKEMFTLIGTEPKIISIENPVIPPKGTPRIEFKNVSFAYPGSDHKVFDNFSMVIKPGQKVAFVGENGSGKTTIVKLLSRFYDVDEGEILINGTNLKKLDLEKWYEKLGVLFQDFLKYEYPFKDNIFFGRVSSPAIAKDIIKAAKQAGADEVAADLPNHYDQILGKTFEGGVNLSTGQWQKLALARGFYRNSSVLILDEPTSAIDARAESKIFSRVEQLSKDKTVFIISHRFSTVRHADKIYVIDKGEIKEAGSHKDLMKLNGIYADLFNIQAKAYQ